jgi:hypothetical protein
VGNAPPVGSVRWGGSRAPAGERMPDWCHSVRRSINLGIDVDRGVR